MKGILKNFLLNDNCFIPLGLPLDVESIQQKNYNKGNRMTFNFIRHIMKKLLLIIPIIFISIISLGFSAIYIWTNYTIKQNIETAISKYRGSSEDALIAFLLDENNTPMDRSHIAIWTLGQIKSEKALPVLKKYYNDDPAGNTCFGKHNSDLCQYEIYKAIIKIEE